MRALGGEGGMYCAYLPRYLRYPSCTKTPEDI